MDGPFRMELRDSAGVRQLVGFDYRNRGRPDLYGEVCGFIKRSFRTCLSRVSGLLDATDPRFVIDLEQGKGGDGTNVLACFDSGTSSGGVFHFRVYYDSFVQIAECILSGLDPKMERGFVSTVYHELMHAADLSSLKSVGAVRDADYRIYGLKSDRVFSVSDGSGYDFNVQWAILDFFSRFRNEGIAILGERLLTGEGYAPSMSVEKAMEMFREAIHVTLRHCRGLRYYNRFESHSAMEELRFSSLMAYECSDVLFAHILDRNRLEHPDAPEKVVDHLLRGGAGTLTDDEILRFVKACIGIDLTEYIQRMLTLPEIDCLEQYLGCCSVIQREENEEAVSAFGRLLAMSAYNRDAETFINVLKTSVGMLMPLHEAREAYGRFSPVGCPERVVEDIMEKTSILFERAEEGRDETAHWALTYLFDRYDLTNDDISFLGWQDDWMVVSGAVRICCPPGANRL